MTAAVTTSDPLAPGEALSRSRSSRQSKPSFRLYFFTALSVLGCALALANVAAAATPSGQDQYIEKAPSGGGTDQADGGLGVVDTNGDGVVTEEEVKKAAEKKKKDARKDGSDEGATGASGAVAGSTTTPTPPAAQSVATAAKFGPVSRGTALIVGGLALIGGLAFFGLGGGTAGIFGSGVAGAAGAAPPHPKS